MSKKDKNMLWTLIISFILHKQLGNKKAALSAVSNEFEHTPGFYQLNSSRMSRYSLEMECKLLAAMSRYDTAKANLDKFSNRIVSSDKRTALFFKLCAADNKVTKSREKLNTALDVTIAANKLARKANRNVNIAYDLAYISKLDLLKRELLKSRGK